MNEKKKLLILKLVWFCLAVLFLTLSIIISPDWRSSISVAFWQLLNATTIIAIFTFIVSLTLSYKEINYYDKNSSTYKKISVYAGFFHHWLKLDDKLVDKYDTLFFVTPIKLHTTIENNVKIEATISTMNRITLKINNEIVV